MNILNLLSRIRTTGFNLLVLLSILSVGHASAQNCKATVKVSRDQNYNAAGEDGALFELELKNNGATTEIFSLETAYLSESCANESLKTNEPNVKLSISYPNIGNKPSSPKDISVKAGETYNFKILVNVPKGTPLKRWSCIEVTAVSKNCKTAISSTILHVFVPDTSEQ